MDKGGTQMHTGGAGNERYGPTIELSGYVDKNRKRLFFMKKRNYVALQGSSLVMYESKLDKDTRDDADGTGMAAASAAKRSTRQSSKAAKSKKIDLADAKIDQTGNNIVIQAKGDRRKYYFTCESVAQATEWMAKLRRVATNDLEAYYKLGKVIGVGSYGEVRLATDLLTGEQVAVKTVQRGKFMSEKEMEFVTREIEVMKKLQHPHIIRTFNIFDSGSKVHFVMEFLAGGDLFDAIAAEQNFSEANASQIIRDILSAVEYLHARNICHRDLKPENILCVERAWPLQVKLTDFGTAFSGEDGDSDPASSGSKSAMSNTMQTYVGTPYYMAPEQMRNERYSLPVDIWACGIILFAMLSGRLPWDAPSEFEYCKAVQTKPLAFPTAQWADISQDAKDIIGRMLATQPSSRISAEEALKHPWLSSSAGGRMTRIKTDRSLLTSMSGRQFGVMAAAAAEQLAKERQDKLKKLQEEDDTDVALLISDTKMAEGIAAAGRGAQSADHHSDSNDSAIEPVEMAASGWKHDEEVLNYLNEVKSLSDLGDKVQEVMVDGGNDSP
ncbi:putative myosin light chain kinase [Porphyridium purpureum]|uniref:Putative myosin light chain kinase n=1 Tax=Porphyridium purpureum TaxID=35688 RepID=A0A5J4YLH5_PORPP|nr:putative myosin light chain kinase [Porphyridium purpureum]|eukprot:POR0706..scf291_13